MLDSLRTIARLEGQIDRWLPKGSRAPRSTEVPLELVTAAVRPEGPAPPLLYFFEHDAPGGLDAPEWLSPYAEQLQHAIGNDLRIVFAAPPQHGKTELTLRGFLYWSRWSPGLKHAYVTYNATRAREVARDFVSLAREAGFRVWGNLDVVHIEGGTQIKFTSIDGGLTGFALTGVCVIDDPLKGPEEARSKLRRRACVRFWKTVARTRRHPGTSFVVMATRWHVDDLSGHLVKHEGFTYINLKAIAEPANDNDIGPDGRIRSDPMGRRLGESLWHKKPPEFFAEEQKDKFWWAAMYQGEPRPEGGAVFEDPTYYSKLPTDFRVGYGVDLAYTAKTSSDWSVCVEGWAERYERRDDRGNIERRVRVYVVDVQRKQVDAPSFTLTLSAKVKTRRGPMRFYGAGTEIGAADFVKRKVPGFKVEPASSDKFVRATPAAAAWNRGDILVPEEAEWLEDFLDVVQSFTGTNDPCDDDVDALAACWDVLNSGSKTIKTPGGASSSRWGGSPGRGF